MGRYARTKEHLLSEWNHSKTYGASSIINTLYTRNVQGCEACAAMGLKVPSAQLCRIAGIILSVRMAASLVAFLYKVYIVHVSKFAVVLCASIYIQEKFKATDVPVG